MALRLIIIGRIDVAAKGDQGQAGMVEVILRVC